MLPLVLWSLVVITLVGGILFLVMRTKWKYKPQIRIRMAIEAAKDALKDKNSWPKLYFCRPEKMEPELMAYHSIKQEDLDKPGIYRMQWPHLDLQYTTKPHSEEVRLHLQEHDKHVTLLYLDGELGSMSLGDEVIRSEAFDMRHAVTLANQFRKHLRKQLCSGYGGHEKKKAAKEVEKPQYQVNATGEIKLAELPPPK